MIKFVYVSNCGSFCNLSWEVFDIYLVDGLQIGASLWISLDYLFGNVLK